MNKTQKIKESFDKFKQETKVAIQDGLNKTTTAIQNGIDETKKIFKSITNGIKIFSRNTTKDDDGLK